MPRDGRAVAARVRAYGTRLHSSDDDPALPRSAAATAMVTTIANAIPADSTHERASSPHLAPCACFRFDGAFAEPDRSAGPVRCRAGWAGRRHRPLWRTARRPGGPGHGCCDGSNGRQRSMGRRSLLIRYDKLIIDSPVVTCVTISL